MIQTYVPWNVHEFIPGQLDFEGQTQPVLPDDHLDEYTEPFFLERIVHKVNALAPDLVLLFPEIGLQRRPPRPPQRRARLRCAGERTPRRAGRSGD